MSKLLDKQPYYQLPNGLQVIDICYYLGFAMGNVFKYLFRYDKKHSNLNKQREDAIKLLTYIVFEEKSLTMFGTSQFWILTSHFPPSQFDKIYNTIQDSLNSIEQNKALLTAFTAYIFTPDKETLASLKTEIENLINSLPNETI